MHCRRWTGTRGGFWSLTMYDKDYYMSHSRTAAQYRHGEPGRRRAAFAQDGSLTLTVAWRPDPEARANWLPAPEGQFALIVRAYVPTHRCSTGRTAAERGSSYRTPQ